MSGLSSVRHMVDATAGFGKDGWAMARAGSSATMLERNPVLYVLLRDGWERQLTPLCSTHFCGFTQKLAFRLYGLNAFCPAVFIPVVPLQAPSESPALLQLPNESVWSSATLRTTWRDGRSGRNAR